MREKMTPVSEGRHTHTLGEVNRKRLKQSNLFVTWFHLCYISKWKYIGRQYKTTFTRNKDKTADSETSRQLKTVKSLIIWWNVPLMAFRTVRQRASMQQSVNKGIIKTLSALNCIKLFNKSLILCIKSSNIRHGNGVRKKTLCPASSTELSPKKE